MNRTREPFSALPRLTATVLCLMVLLASATASATHRVDERFTVWGRVTDADGAPVAGQRVDVIVAAGKQSARLRTDAEGWYRKVLAVDNDGLGKVFDVQVARQVRHVKVQFDPDDHVKERGTRVDFVVSP